MQRHRIVRQWRALVSLIPLTAGAWVLYPAIIQVEPVAPRQPIGSALPERFTGVNLSGAEFSGNRLPGVAGRDYAYPTAKTAAPFVAAGMTAVRLPFRWERLQPTPLQPLDAHELARLDTAVSELRNFRLIVLDAHNYAAYRRFKIGTAETTTTMLADFWSRVSAHFRNDPQIAFGIMNEPSGLPSAIWRQAAQDALSAIRRTGARNLVLVPGANWTGAHSWTSGGLSSNATLMATFVDPAKNVAFEMHQYLDKNYSGTGADCISTERAKVILRPATEWLRLHHARGFLAEFGAPDTSKCLSALNALLKSMDDDRDVWLGWTYWAGGDRWNSYPMSIQPGPNGPAVQMSVLKPYLSR